MRLGKLHPSVFSTTYSYWEPGAYPKEHGAQGWVSSCILYSPETWAVAYSLFSFILKIVANTVYANSRNFLSKGEKKKKVPHEDSRCLFQIPVCNDCWDLQGIYRNINSNSKIFIWVHLHMLHVHFFFYLYNPSWWFLECSCIPGQCLALQAMVSSSEKDEQHSNLWLLAREELHSALIISRALASRDPQLEADILYLKGKHSQIRSCRLCIRVRN